MLRGLLVTLLFVAFAMPPPASAAALEPEPVGDPFEAGPAAPPPPPVHFQSRGSGPRTGACRHSRRSRYHFGPGHGPGFGPQRRSERYFGFGPGRHGGPYDFSRGFGRGYTRLGRGRGFGPGRMLFSERARRQWGLTEEQSSRLRKLGLEARKSAIRRRADLETKQLELEELLRVAKPDRAAIDRTVQEIGALHAAQMKAGIDQRLAFQDVLTPEQLEKIREFQQHGFREWRPRRGAQEWDHGDRPGRYPRPSSQPDPPPSPTEP